MFCCFSPFGFWHLCKESHQTFATSLGGTSFDDFFLKISMFAQWVQSQFETAFEFLFIWVFSKYSYSFCFKSIKHWEFEMHTKYGQNKIQLHKKKIMETFKFHLVVVCSLVISFKLELLKQSTCTAFATLKKKYRSIIHKHVLTCVNVHLGLNISGVKTYN